MLRRAFGSALLFGISAVRALCQSREIAELSKEESARGAELYKRMLSADKNWDNFRDEIREKYGQLHAKGAPPETIQHFITNDGREFAMNPEWTEDIEFTSDFRFAIPKQYGLSERRPKK